MPTPLTYNERQVRLIRTAMSEAAAGAHSATQSSAGTTNSYTRHGLDELRRLEAHYLALVGAERRGGAAKIVVADFGGAL